MLPLLLLACDTPSLTAPADHPTVSDVAVDVSRSADSTTFTVRYSLPAPCWSSHTVVSEPEPGRFLLTIDHSPQSTCRDTDAPTEEQSAVTMDGDHRDLEVVIDGETVYRMAPRPSGE